MKDCMVDLETMGVGNKPALLQVSAVMFDINTGEVGSEFNMKVDLQSSMNAGLEVSAGTIKFWMTNQTVTQEARLGVMEETGDHGAGGNELKEVMLKFREWLIRNEVKYIHGNGAASDNVWIRSAFSSVGVEDPVKFWGDMCFRTIKTLCKRAGWQDTVKREGVYHDGLDDAKHQVRVLSSMFVFLEGEEELYCV